MRREEFFHLAILFKSLSSSLEAQEEVGGRSREKRPSCPLFFRKDGHFVCFLCYPPLLSSCGFNLFFSSSISEREREMREIEGGGKRGPAVVAVSNGRLVFFSGLHPSYLTFSLANFPFVASFPLPP